MLTRSFSDRRHAGELLARELVPYAGRDDVLVLGLPRGGVPVAYEIARGLGAPLDVLVVRKLGVPGYEELAMGAIASGGIRVTDPQVVGSLGVSADALKAVQERELAELARRERAFRGDRPPLDVAGKTVILVDDGLATGSTMLAAIEAMRARKPDRIVVAVPVAPPQTCQALRTRVDELICLLTPDRMAGVGVWYQDFRQTSDDEVRQLLVAARQPAPARPASGTSPELAEPIQVTIDTAQVELAGDLAVSQHSVGLVVFVHGSGSSRLSPRNRFVAEALRRAGLGTLLFDLLTPEEESVDNETAELRFDIALLASRVSGSLRWLRERAGLRDVPIGLFGASTGAAAALVAAATTQDVTAIVSRGGRPDLAGGFLEHVAAPTLLIVGGEDRAVLGLNRAAFARLRCPRGLHVVDGATHLFEEPGALDEVITVTARWFSDHLVRHAASWPSDSQGEQTPQGEQPAHGGRRP